MSMNGELHSQIASIMEVLANSAVAEICKAVEDGYAVMNLEVSRGQKENECLRRRVRLLELQVSRYRAEQRLKPPVEGAASGRVFPGVRLFRSGRDTPTGFSLHGRTRVANRSFVSQPQQKTPPLNLDQDPDQEVVTTTKTEPIEPEEDSDLVIVKVEGSVSVEEPGVSNNNNNNLRTSTSDPRACSQTEVSGSQTRTLPLSHSLQTPHEQSSSLEDVIVIDGETSDKTKTYVDKWLSFQAPVTETAGVSTDVAALLLNKTAAPSNQQTVNLPSNLPVCTQRFETLNKNTSAAHFSGSKAQSSTAQNSFSGAAFAQGSPSMRVFSCSKCPMRFSLEAELAKHAASHRVRKYVCGLCGKGFLCKSQLEIHQNVHTGEKPFKCPLCNSGFSHPSNLRRHKKLQHQLPAN